MTRINVVPVSELSKLHLIAEYREITRLPKNLETSLNRKGKKFELREIPEKYTLGTGHVKFFYDKMAFLEKRFGSLVQEMLDRGYNPTYRDLGIFSKCDKQFYNDYTPTSEAIEINKARIKERTKMITIKDFYPIWNELHCKNIVYGSNARNELMANWLESQILEAKAAYYKSEKTLYDDQTYDKLEEYLKVLRPESIVLEKVGV